MNSARKPHVSKAYILDRELRCHGTSLGVWSENHGIPTHMLISMLDGKIPVDEQILADLATTLGVTPIAVLAA